MWTKYREISLILIFALLIRLVLFLFLEPWNSYVINSSFFLVPDTKEYQNLALGLLNNHNFNDYNYFRTPGYPLLIAFFYSIFGIKPWIIILFQILISLISIFVTYLLANEMFNKKIGIISAFIFSIEPHSVLHTTIFLADTILILLFLLSAFSLYNSIKKEKLSLLILSAILLGVSTYFKQITQYYLIIGIILIFVYNKTSILIKTKKSIIYLIFYFIIISPWMFHNYLKFNHFQFATTQGYNLLMDNVSIVELNIKHKTIKEVRKEFRNIAKNSLNENSNQFDYSDTYHKIAFEYIKNHPFIYAKYHLSGIKNFFLTLNTHTFMRHFGFVNNENPISLYDNTKNSFFQSVNLFFKTKPILEILIGLSIAIYLSIIYILFGFGAYFIFKEKNYFLLFFIVSIIIYFAILSGAIGYARYKLPVIPFYTIVGAYGFNIILNKIKNQSLTKKNI